MRTGENANKPGEIMSQEGQTKWQNKNQLKETNKTTFSQVEQGRETNWCEWAGI